MLAFPGKWAGPTPLPGSHQLDPGGGGGGGGCCRCACGHLAPSCRAVLSAAASSSSDHPSKMAPICPYPSTCQLAMHPPTVHSHLSITVGSGHIALVNLQHQLPSDEFLWQGHLSQELNLSTQSARLELHGCNGPPPTPPPSTCRYNRQTQGHC